MEPPAEGTAETTLTLLCALVASQTDTVSPQPGITYDFAKQVVEAVSPGQRPSRQTRRQLLKQSGVAPKYGEGELPKKI